jgi:hypothetical protein
MPIDMTIIQIGGQLYDIISNYTSASKIPPKLGQIGSATDDPNVFPMYFTGAGQERCPTTNKKEYDDCNAKAFERISDFFKRSRSGIK